MVLTVQAGHAANEGEIAGPDQRTSLALNYQDGEPKIRRLLGVVPRHLAIGVRDKCPPRCPSLVSCNVILVATGAFKP
jgi:hypothetical protein